MKKLRTRILFVIALLAVFASNALVAEKNSPLIGKTWKLVEINGKPTKWDESILLHKEGIKDYKAGTIDSESACNGMQSRYQLKEPDQLRILPGMYSLVACSEDVEKAQDEFFSMIDQVATYHIEGNQLLLFSDKDKTKPIAKFIDNSLKLIGVRWELWEMNGEEIYTANTIILLDKDGKISGSTVCGNITNGEYELKEPHHIQFGSILITENTCEKERKQIQAIMQQVKTKKVTETKDAGKIYSLITQRAETKEKNQSRLLNIMQQAKTYDIEGNHLRLYSDSNRTKLLARFVDYAYTHPDARSAAKPDTASPPPPPPIPTGHP